MEIVTEDALRIASKEEQKTLRELEALALTAKKEVYGGVVAVQEIMKKSLTVNKK